MKIFSTIWRGKIPERIWGAIMTNFERAWRGFGLIKNEVLGLSEALKSLCGWSARNIMIKNGSMQTHSNSP